MGTSVLVALLVAGFGGEPPDGRLVLGVAGSEPGSDAVTREWAAVADPRSGEVRKRRLEGGALCHGPVLAVGDRVVFSGHRGRRAVARALPLTLRGPANSLGAADTLTPLHSRAAVWLGRWRGRGDTARIGLHQVSPRGDVQVRARILGARWSLLYAALKRGFVISRPNSLVVWDHWLDTRAFRVRGGWFLGASETRVAWCDGDCRSAHLWSRRSGRGVTLPAQARPLGREGAFSPDGRTLALGVRLRGETRIALVEARSGSSTLVPGGRLGGYEAIEWSPSGRWLYFTDANTGIRAWRLGGPPAQRLPLDPGGTVMSIDVAP